MNLLELFLAKLIIDYVFFFSFTITVKYLYSIEVSVAKRYLLLHYFG